MLIQLNPVDDYIDELLDWAHKDFHFERICLEEARSLGCADAELLMGISQFYFYINIIDGAILKNPVKHSFVGIFSISPDSDFFNKKWKPSDDFSYIRDQCKKRLENTADSTPIALGYLGKNCLEIAKFRTAEDYFEKCYDYRSQYCRIAIRDAIPFNILSAMYYFGLYVKQDYRMAVKWAYRGADFEDAMSCFILG